MCTTEFNELWRNGQLTILTMRRRIASGDQTFRAGQRHLWWATRSASLALMGQLAYDADRQFRWTWSTA